MKEYSLENADFKKISLAQVKMFFDVLTKSQKSNISYIRDKYQKRAAFFEETSLFLSKLDIIEEVEGTIHLSDNSVGSHSDIKAMLLTAMFGKGNKIGVLASYLENFTQLDEVYIFKPSAKKNLQTSGIRNLLLELTFLTYNHKEGTYSISEYGRDFFLAFQRHTSVEQLELALRRRDKLGLQAELVVLEYERSKLKRNLQLVKNIKHVSRFDVGAGYDILSFSFVSEEIFEKKYIEVKAVSGKSFDFHWSINEVEVAKQHGGKYYLYLVPVISGGKFDLKNMRIISDPYKQFCEKEHFQKMKSMLFYVSPG